MSAARALPAWALAALGALASGQELPPSGHPPIPLLDRDGQPVQRSQQPVSTQRTCGGCHDVATIAQGYHSQLGFDEPASDSAPSGRAGDVGPGLWGRWDPRLGPPGDARADLATWLRLHADLHVGGGPGADLQLEVDCFVCHTPHPNLDARAATVRAGRFAEAPSATLLGSGLVERTPDGLRWRADAFAPTGASPALLGLQPPGDRQCLACHGLSAAGEAPLWAALPTPPAALGDEGLVFGAQRVSDSALNLRDKDALTRPWDVHAARLVGCADCHPPLNAPGGFLESEETRPSHLAESPRRPSVGEFLRSPSHDFRKGSSSQGTVARRLSGSQRDCRGCHASVSHASWLPFSARHLEGIACQACHIPRALLPARRLTDWSVPDPAGAPRVELRGVEGDPADPATLIEGWQPLLLPRRAAPDGAARLQPLNLQATAYWVSGATGRPVPLDRLAAALHQGHAFHPEVVALLDRDGDGALAADERWLSDAAQVAAIAARLEAVGVASPRLQGELIAQELHHGVVEGAFAVRDCRSCHDPGGRLGGTWLLAERAPFGVEPTLLGDATVSLPGQVLRAEGRLTYVGAPTEDSHAPGYGRSAWIDGLGLALLLLTLAGASGHGLLRWLAGRGA
ncbi:MAG: hypothetical protein KDD82_18955 [Planctomycetes bacterium]|nr:hypothetical protein [Planctomycetota bacterium]